MAFDFGTQRIGVAFGQSLLGSARPLQTLKARDGVPDWQLLADLLAEWQPQVLVVGHPLNMDDSDNPVTLRARKFARKLEGRFHLPCHLWDERLSTRSAWERLEQDRHAGELDSIAAQVILESYFRSYPEKPA